MTLNALFEELKGKLCNPPYQDFELGSIIRDLQRRTDLQGTKELSEEEIATTRAFFEILLRKN